ncbi:MAG TPA: S-adenosylmethionine:tRNA ribosyltransferase-isomerase [Acidimicrobiales bacterium]
MDLDDFAYDLPAGAIAQHPAEPRDAARLLVDRGTGRPAAHRSVADVPGLVRPGDVVVVNTTRVLPARLRLRKDTGGEVEVLLLERTAAGPWEAMVRPSRRVRPGTVLAAGPDLAVRVGGPGTGDGTRLVTLLVDGDQPPPGAPAPASGGKVAGARVDPAGGDAAAPGVDVLAPGVAGVEAPRVDAGGIAVPASELAALRRHGVVPLPPYITAPLADAERYQTVFADRPGSVAAPTAGLHLTLGILDRCRAAGARVVGVELEVGRGTFRPMTAPKVEDHHMHAERYRVAPEAVEACRAARAAGGRVVAVGTTTVRALESVALTGELSGRTELFIHRPWDWRAVDVLMTNFHLPRSSLLVLVDAFVGPRWRDLYATALAEGYRFLSFGDALWLERTGEGVGP